MGITDGRSHELPKQEINVMRSGRVTRIVLNLVVLLLALSVFFGLAELTARAIYPEFANQFHSRELTAGKRIHRGEVFGLKTRLPAANAEVEPSAGTPVIIVVGDSVANGYGLSYHDTFWAVWQRYFRIQGKLDKVIVLSGYGNNFMDNIDSIVHAVNVFRDHGQKVTSVIYQFNFNDLLPSTRADLQEWGEGKSVWEWLRQGSWIAPLRHEFLNYSVFLRVISIKGAALFRAESTSCAELGRSAMGGYSHAFMAKGLEEQGARSWQSFENNVTTLLRNLKDIRFAILISPMSPLVHPGLPEHHVALPTRMDCATIDPVQRLDELSRSLGFPICNPAPYLSEAFRRYRDEGNTKILFHENDENHPNEMGSLLIGEYCYERLFQQGQLQE